MTYELLFTRGPLRNRTWTIPPTGSLKVGSGKDCEVSIPDAAVSRYHCYVEMREGKPWVGDLASNGGLVVNGVVVVRTNAVTKVVGAPGGKPAPTPEAKKCPCPPGTKHLEKCPCGGLAGCSCLVVEPCKCAVGDGNGLMHRAPEKCIDCWGCGFRLACP